MNKLITLVLDTNDIANILAALAVAGGRLKIEGDDKNSKELKDLSDKILLELKK